MAPFLTRLRSRVAHLYFLLAKPMTLGVRGVVIDENDRVLLVRHSYISGWHFPGGGVEARETVADALARELEEEARVALRGEPVLHGLFFNVREFAEGPYSRLCDPRIRCTGRARTRLGNQRGPLLSAFRPTGRNNGGHARKARRDF